MLWFAPLRVKLRSRAMPIYFFGVNDQPADRATGEDLPHDRAAREWAARVAKEVNRNRRHTPAAFRFARSTV
jgi:hypothetical protein